MAAIGQLSVDAISRQTSSLVKLLDAEDGEHSLADYKGKWVVLNFWASWCGVCHVLAPMLNGWHDRYSAQGVTVLGVTTDPVELAGRTAGEVGMGYPLASDGSGWAGVSGTGYTSTFSSGCQ